MIFSFTMVNPAVSLAKQDTLNFKEGLRLQVIQEQLMLDNSTIKTASLVNNSSDGCNINITLKPQAAAKLKKMTRANINKQATIIFGDKVINFATIKSSLSAQFQITGFTKEEAQLFIDNLSGGSHGNNTEYKQ